MVHMKTQLPDSCLARIQSAVFRSDIWPAGYWAVSNVPGIFQTTITKVKLRIHCNPYKWLKVWQNGPFHTFPPCDIHCTTHDKRKIVLAPKQSIPEFTQDHETVLTSKHSSVSNKTSMMSTVSSRSIVKYLISDMIAARRASEPWLWWWPTVKKTHTIAVRLQNKENYSKLHWRCCRLLGWRMSNNRNCPPFGKS